MDETVYDVFARKGRGDPLHHVGYLHALDDEMARVYAWKTYDEESWFEMCVVPRSAIVPVNRDDGPYAARRGPRHAAPAPAAEVSVPPGQPYGGDS